MPGMALAEELAPDDVANNGGLIVMEPPLGTLPMAWQTSRGGTTLKELVAMKLSTRQDVMYPAHGYGRGGIGTFLATGASRAGTAKLPHGHKATTGLITARALSAGSATNTRVRPWTTGSRSMMGSVQNGANSTADLAPSSRTWNQSRGSMHSRAGSCRASAASGMSKTWEQALPHPHDFMVASRSTRIHDVPVANRWAAMSFYENDPAEIKRHLDITGQLDQLHATGKAEEHAADQKRREVWAAAQRGTFRRQRQEVAMRYQALNLPLRPTHQYVLEEQMAMDAAAASEEQAQAAGYEQDTEPLAAAVPAHAVINLPKPTYVKVYDRMNHEMRESPRMKEEMWRRGRASARMSREKAEVDADVASLNAFEEQLQALQRQRARSQYAEPE